MTRIGTVGREPMTGTAHPAAIARMVGVLGLRAQEDGAPPVTEPRGRPPRGGGSLWACSRMRR
jgi:hypothetical protein